MGVFGNTFGKGNPDSMFCVEAKNLFARMTVQPTLAKKIDYNLDFIELKATGILNTMDCLWFTDLADQQSSCLNWVKNAHNLTPILSPTFTAFQGFTGSTTTGASSKYLKTNYNPSTNAVNFTRATPFVAVNLPVAVATGGKAAIGNTDVDGIILMPNYTATQRYFRLNSGSWGVTVNSGDGHGIHILTRPTGLVFPNEKIYNYQEGVETQTGNVLANISNTEIYLLNDTSLSRPYDGVVSAAAIGGGLTYAQSVLLTGIMKSHKGVHSTISTFFGDSITVGTGSTSGANGYSTIFSTSQGTIRINFGISGRTLQSHPTIPDGTSIYEHIGDIPHYTRGTKYLFFEAGTNDAGTFDAVSYPSGTTRFETQYNEIIAAAKAKGWPASKIKMLTIFRRDDTKEDIYNAKLVTIASTNGVQLLDTGSVLSANSATYMSDALHPNDAGHAAMAAYISSNIT